MPDVLDLHRVWEVPAFLPYVQPPLTDAILAAAEQQLGVTLPRRYVDLLRIQNGGYVRLNLPDHPHHRLFGIGPGEGSILTFRWPDYAAFRTGIIPIDGEATWYLAFDYRHTIVDPPLVSVDMSDDVPCHPFLPSFDDYLGRLFLKLTWNELGIVEDIDEELLMEHIARRLDLPRKPTSDAGSGYPIQLCGRPGIWVRCEPNRVPRGFIRPDDPGYHERKDSFPGTALRFPEFPQYSWIISSTDNIFPALYAALRDMGINVAEMYIDRPEEPPRRPARSRIRSWKN